MLSLIWVSLVIVFAIVRGCIIVEEVVKGCIPVFLWIMVELLEEALETSSAKSFNVVI